MHRWRSATFFLILAIGNSIAETVKNVPGYTTLPESVQKSIELQADTGKLDYESALRPAVLQKRSIANIARLLLGGNVPPNHPLVKYPEPKSWNLANNIVASLPGSSALMAAASSQSEGWSRPSSNALQNIQHLFETKAKIIPYTGQVATGLTGLASVKGDLIRQIHSISTQAIAQAAAEAAARALASAAAAHAVTNSIAHSVNPGAQTGIKGGWSSYQNAYAEPLGKTPGEQPGPPYQDSSAHINHYQPPPASYNPYAATTPSPVVPTLPPPTAYQNQPQQYQSYLSQPQNPQYSSQPQNPQPYPTQAQNPQQYQTQPQHSQSYHTQPQNPQPYPTQPQQPYQNGYYTLYNTQQSTSNVRPQTPYTPAPPVPHARPTLSPTTLIATTPSGYSPSLSNPLLPSTRLSKAIPVIVHAPGSNNTPLTSFRRAVPAGIFGRNAAQPASTTSLLSSISSLLSASTAAYNAAFTGANSNQQQQQSPAVFSTLLSSASSPHSATSSVHRPTSSIASHSPSLLSSGIGSSAYNNAYQQQQSSNSLSQGGGHYGGVPSGSSTGYFQHSAGSAYPSEARSASVNSPSYSFNQHVSGNSGTNYAQPGGNPYASQSVQPSSQFGSGLARPTAASGVTNNGVGVPGYPTAGAGYNPGYNPGPVGSGYPGYNGGAGPSTGHASGWDTQHAGPSASASSWPGGSNVYTPGYASQASGNTNNSPGGFGGPGAAQFPVAAGSAVAQQTYSAPQANAYQPPAPNNYAQAQQVPYAQQPSQLNGYPNGYQITSGNSNSIGGFRNSNLGNRYESQDLRQSASTMGNDYDEEDDDAEGDEEEETAHHNYQQAQRRNRPPPKKSYSGSRYPSPSKKRPTKRPINNNSYNSNTGSRNSNQQNRNHNSNSNQHDRNHNSNQQIRNHNSNSHHQHERSQNSNQINKNKHGSNVRKDVGETGKRVIPTGPKKGSHFDSSVDVVDASVDGFSDGDRYSQSDEIRNDNNDPDTDKNRWRTKNPSGQRPNSFHNHNSNGRWSGKTSYTKQAPPKNVRGNGGGSERPRPQPGQANGGPSKNHGSKKVPPKQERQQQEKKQHQSGKPKTEAAHIYRGRLRPEQQRKQQQQPTTTVHYKSRDVYTTLPEFVFRVGERPDVFLRPGGKHRKQRVPLKGRGSLHPRVGETDGTGGNRRSDATEEETLDTSPSKHIYDEANSREDFAETNLEKSTSFTRPLLDTTAGGGEEEEFISASEAVDETARADILSDQMASNSGFITSEELDPEEREAFVDDVYADEFNHHPQRRQDYDEEGVESAIQAMSEENEDDLLDKK